MASIKNHNIIETKASETKGELYEELEIEKFTLAILPTQFGKTFLSIEYMQNEIARDREEGLSIHLVLTMNTYFNSEQFANRLEVIEDANGKGSVCIFNSSKKETNYKHVNSLESLQGLCSNMSKKIPHSVVMCNNKKRNQDCFEFVMSLTHQQDIKRVFIYYDELHKYIDEGELRYQIEQIHSYDILKGMIATSATPEKVIKETGFWSKIRLIYLQNFDDSNYVGHSDLNYITIDDTFPTPYIRPRGFGYQELEDENINHISQVLSRYPSILDDNTRSFIPVHRRRLGHTRLRDLLFDMNERVVVLIINSVEKTMQFKNEAGNKITISMISRTGELCETIMKKVKEHNLKSRPIVITGFLCVGMGQTLVHRELGPFTSAIFGHMDLTNDDIYQLFGRVTGRMKSWETYDQNQLTKVYCPSVIMTRCGIMEKSVRNMIENYNGKVITRENYMEPIFEEKATEENIRRKKENKTTITRTRSNNTDFTYEVFDTFEDAKNFCLTTFDVSIKNKTTVPDRLKQNGVIGSLEYIVDQKWGLGPKNRYRAYPTNSGKWVVYWRPSTLRK